LTGRNRKRRSHMPNITFDGPRIEDIGRKRNWSKR
jgi:hypothetical protein